MSQPPNNPEPDDITTTLALVQDHISTLADMAGVSGRLSDDLSYLYETGANAETLQNIADGATILIERGRQQDEALYATLKVAFKLKQQREATQRELDTLRQDVREINLAVPEIARLSEDIEQMMMDDTETYFYEMMGETLAGSIADNTPLSYTEAAQMTNLLMDGDELPDGLWHELKDWIVRAQEASQDPYGYLSEDEEDEV